MSIGQTKRHVNASKYFVPVTMNQMEKDASDDF